MSLEEGRTKLSNVLIAYARWDPHVGYVQGMNFIVANLLLHADEEVVILAMHTYLDKLRLRMFTIGICFISPDDATKEVQCA